MHAMTCRWAAIGVVGMFAVGCGSRSASPTAPSGEPPASAQAPVPSGASLAGATISGNIAGASPAALAGVRTLGVSAVGVSVSITGTGVSATTDATGNFTLNDVPSSDVVLAFVGPGIDAVLPLGVVSDHDTVHIMVTLSGSTATLDAEHRVMANQAAEAEGLIDSIDVAGRRLVLSGIVVVAPDGASIRRGDAAIAFVDLKQGERVHVRGTTDGSAIRASEITARSQTTAPVPPVTPPPTTPPPPPPAAPAPVAVTFSGVVVGVRDACPSLTLKVGDTYVRTDAATAFPGKSCGDIKVGDTASGAGTRQGDEVVLAVQLTVASAPPPPPPPPVSFSGTVAGFRGTCPSLTLKVGDTYVVTNGATAFPGKSCGAIQVGDAASGAGSKQSDGLVLASRLELKN